MIRKWPTGNQEMDARTAPKRDGPAKFGAFGTIAYTYLLALESKHQTNLKTGITNGILYHPVDTPEEAAEWLEFYRSKTLVRGHDRRAVYDNAWFIPTIGDD